MTKPLSLDLRTRVVAAVDSGLSRRQAAERFGVSAASAVRWSALKAQVGSPAPKPQGGDRRSGKIEAHAELILKLLDEKKDITLADMQAKLLEHGVKAGIGTLWRFFDRHDITLKKSRRTPRSNSGRTS
jgi:transposase